MQDGMDSDNGEEWTLCIQSAEQYVEPPNDIDIEMTAGKLKNKKATSMIKFWLNWWKMEGKSSRRSFMNSFKKFGRNILCYMSGYMA